MNGRFVGALSVLGISAALVSCGGGGGGTVTPPVTTGTVSGSVTNGGAGVSGVVISLPGKGTQTTSSSGAYTFTQVNAGSHTLTLTLPSEFELASGETLEKSVSVTAGQTATVNWALQAKAATSTVDTVRLSGTSFEPSNLTIKAGRTVVWVNTQSIAHTVTPDGHTAWQRTETSAPGEVLRVTMNSTGSFDYYCEPHRSQGMTGRIVVEQ